MAIAPGVRTTNGRGRLFESILDTVGDTPCIRVDRKSTRLNSSHT